MFFFFCSPRWPPLFEQTFGSVLVGTRHTLSPLFCHEIDVKYFFLCLLSSGRKTIFVQSLLWDLIRTALAQIVKRGPQQHNNTTITNQPTNKDKKDKKNKKTRSSLKPGVIFSVVDRMFAHSVGTMVDGEHAFATSGGAAWRRRQRRPRALRRFILWSTKMEVAAALHHMARQRTRLADDATQTTSACDHSNASTQTETYAVFDYIAPPPVNLNIAPPLAATCAATSFCSNSASYQVRGTCTC